MIYKIKWNNRMRVHCAYQVCLRFGAKAPRAPKNRSRATPFVRFFLRHSLSRGQCFALPYNLPKPSQTAGTLCAMFLNCY